MPKGKYVRTTEIREKNRQGGFGRKHSPETLEKMSLAHLGKKNHFFGKKHTPEAIVKMSGPRKEDVGYAAVHYRVKKMLPKPERCQMCNNIGRLNLANLTGIYNMDLANWAYLCYRCHSLYDGWINNIPKAINNKDFTGRVCSVCGGQTTLNERGRPRWFIHGDGFKCRKCYARMSYQQKKAR